MLIHTTRKQHSREDKTIQYRPVLSHPKILGTHTGQTSTDPVHTVWQSGPERRPTSTSQKYKEQGSRRKRKGDLIGRASAWTRWRHSQAGCTRLGHGHTRRTDRAHGSRVSSRDMTAVVPERGRSVRPTSGWLGLSPGCRAVELSRLRRAAVEALPVEPVEACRG